MICSKALVAGTERGLTLDDNRKAFDELGFAPHVVGLPDEKYGEVVAAFVVKKQDSDFQADQPRSRKQTPVPGRVQMARRKWWRTSRVSSEGLS